MRTLGLALFFVCSVAFTDIHSPLWKNYETQVKEGKLITLTLALGNPMKLFVAEKEEARLDFNKMKLSVRRISPYPGEELKVTRDGHIYTILGAKNRPRELEVTATVNENREVFYFNLKKEKP